LFCDKHNANKLVEIEVKHNSLRFQEYNKQTLWLECELAKWPYYKIEILIAWFASLINVFRVYHELKM